MFRTLDYITESEVRTVDVNKLHGATASPPSGMMTTKSEVWEPKGPREADGKNHKFTFEGLTPSSSAVNETRDVQDSQHTGVKENFHFNNSKLNDIADGEERDDSTVEHDDNNNEIFAGTYVVKEDEQVTLDSSIRSNRYVEAIQEQGKLDSSNKNNRYVEAMQEIVFTQGNINETEQGQLIGSDDRIGTHSGSKDTSGNIILVQGSLVDSGVDNEPNATSDDKGKNDFEKASSEIHQIVAGHSIKTLKNDNQEDPSLVQNQQKDEPETVHESVLKRPSLGETMNVAKAAELIDLIKVSGDEETKRPNEVSVDVAEKSTLDNFQFAGDVIVNEIVSEDVTETIEVNNNGHILISSDVGKSLTETGTIPNIDDEAPDVVTSPTPSCIQNIACYFAPESFIVLDENDDVSKKIEKIDQGSKHSSSSSSKPGSQVEENQNLSLVLTTLTDDNLDSNTSTENLDTNTSAGTGDTSSSSSEDHFEKLETDDSEKLGTDHSVKLDTLSDPARIDDSTLHFIGTEDAPFDEAPMLPKLIAKSPAHSLAYFPAEFCRETYYMQKKKHDSADERSLCVKTRARILGKRKEKKPEIRTLTGIKQAKEDKSKFEYDFIFSARAFTKSISANGCYFIGTRNDFGSPKSNVMDKQPDYSLSDLSPGSARARIEETDGKNKGQLPTHFESDVDENQSFCRLLDFWGVWDKSPQASGVE